MLTKTFGGKSTGGNFQEALTNAIQNAMQAGGIVDNIVTWKLMEIRGENGGISMLNNIIVTIEVGFSSDKRLNQLGNVSELVLSSIHNGTIIETSQNQIININVGSHSAGCEWKFVEEPDANILKFVSREYMAVSPDWLTNHVGASAPEFWKFQTIGKGKTSLKLGEFGPSDPQKIWHEFKVTIVVI